MQTPPGKTPGGQTPPRQTSPPNADTPQTPPPNADTPSQCRHPLRHPLPMQTPPPKTDTPRQTPPGQTPPPLGRHPLPWADTPSPSQTLPWADTPGQTPPPRWPLSGRYASYWNAFLFPSRFHSTFITFCKRKLFWLAEQSHFSQLIIKRFSIKCSQYFRVERRSCTPGRRRGLRPWWAWAQT